VNIIYDYLRNEKEKPICPQLILPTPDEKVLIYYTKYLLYSG
jgi:hypothetical protein